MEAEFQNAACQCIQRSHDGFQFIRHRDRFIRSGSADSDLTGEFNAVDLLLTLDGTSIRRMARSLPIQFVQSHSNQQPPQISGSAQREPTAPSGEKETAVGRQNNIFGVNALREFRR